MLTVSHLQSAYGDSQVLFDVSFTVGSGEVVTLLGRNGMGKTTTVSSIIGLVRPHGGEVAFDGRRDDRRPQPAGALDPRARPRALPPPRRAARPPRVAALGGRAADARHRTRPDDEPEAPHP